MNMNNVIGPNQCVDLTINTFERTYREVLSSGFFKKIEESNCRRFTNRVVLINNVNDVQDAKRRAQQLIDEGEIDSYYFVQEHLDSALSQTGLIRKDLRRFPHFLDWAIVAVTLPGSQWILHWDAEVELQEPVNWVDSAINLMERDRRILIANPNWNKAGIKLEALEYEDDFAFSYGMSDQVFLARRAELARPIYNYFCPASLRYPLSHIMGIFEKRVDAYMRRTRQLRATYLPATYIHPTNEGQSYLNMHLNNKETISYYSFRLVIKALKILKLKTPCLSVSMLLIFCVFF